MEFREYQRRARDTLVISDKPLMDQMDHAVFGLLEECGEVAGVLKRAARGDYGSGPDFNTPAFQGALLKELGDVLWYLAETATVHGFSLESVAQVNLMRLAQRKEAGTIIGSGDR